MLESGIIVAIGLLVTFSTLSWPNRYWMLSHPLVVDVIVFILLNFIHWGTADGVMMAALAALLCSLMLSLGRLLFGYYEGKTFVPGRFRGAP